MNMRSITMTIGDADLAVYLVTCYRHLPIKGAAPGGV